MPFIKLTHFRQYFKEYGSGKPVIFLHGFTLDRRMWRPQVDFFRQYYRVITPDTRGHGLSDAPDTGYSRADRVEDLKDFADKMKIDRFHGVGLSMGGSTLIGFALKYPERLISMTLVSSGAAGYDIGKKISKIDDLAKTKGIEAAREKWKNISLKWFDDEKNEIRDLMETMINEHSGAVWQDPRRGKYPREYDLEKIHRIKVPTKIICGGEDKIFSQLGRLLNEKNPSSEFIVLNNVGHMVNLEIPDRFNAELKVFLEAM
ncbi:MAG: alpha/beta hydrolase [candidate division Zixibacteria bacterium]|nr:alpha/beta hydrolase [candidate division Zixibacteria bacterium]